MNTSLSHRRTYVFGDFELQVATRLLLRDGKRVAIGSKAFEVLTCLVAHAGQVVSKEDLLKTVWPTSFVEESNLSQHVFALRRALADRADLIVTVPGRGYQFTGAVREAPVDGPEPGPETHEVIVRTMRERSRVVIEDVVMKEMPHAGLAAPVELLALPAAAPNAGSGLRRRWVYSAAAVALAGLAGWAGWAHWHRTAPDEVHTMMVADFVNTTGDETFDRTLKRALEIELGQSPSLSVMSASEAVGLLGAMGQKSDTALTGEVAREVCMRGNRQMLLTGGIASVGKAYLLTLEAVDCNTGKKLASAKEQATRKEDVLGALDSIADRLRSKLGESAKSLESYQVPIMQATTPSLEALKLYSIGQSLDAQGWDEASRVVFYQRAVELDPKFAMAWGAMASEYYNLNEYDLAAETYKKAIALSDRVSLRERLTLQAHYYGESQNDALQAAKAYALWGATFPRDWAPEVNLCNLYHTIGMYERALPDCQEGLRRQPARAISYSVYVRALKDSNRFTEAKAIAAQAIARKLDSTGVHGSLYEIAVGEDDAAAIARETEWAAAHSDSWYKWESVEQQAGTAATRGRYRAARELYRKAWDVAVHEDLQESVRDVLLDEAMVELELGLPADARATLNRTGGDLTKSSDAAEVRAGLGDVAGAEKFLTLEQAQPNLGTKMAFIHVPVIKATLALSRGKALEALEDLQPASPYEMESYRVPSLRGAAYLKAGQPSKAADEYRKVLANRGVDTASPLYPLAHLGLARAYVAAGDAAKGRAEYEAFLDFWKDADPDLPPLHEARVELERLRAK